MSKKILDTSPLRKHAMADLYLQSSVKLAFEALQKTVASDLFLDRATKLVSLTADPVISIEKQTVRAFQARAAFASSNERYELIANELEQSRKNALMSIQLRKL